MSVLCACTNGWVIAHDHFIRSVYERVEGTPTRRFAFDSSLFQINTPFARLLCINKDNSVAEVNSPTSLPRRRRKKQRNGTVNNEAEDVRNDIFCTECLGR
jgi:hypothetical protein